MYYSCVVCMCKCVCSQSGGMCVSMWCVCVCMCSVMWSVCVCACVQNHNCASDGRKQLGKEERHQLVSCLVHLEHAQVL